jgi:asparagine synthetase B (glutamine-hydrolysing)
MQIGYVGGIVERGTLTPPDVPGWDLWHWCGPDHEAFLLAGGAGCHLVRSVDGSLAVLLRGFVVDTRSQDSRDHDSLARKVLAAYRDCEELPLDGLEGSFTLALFDGPAGRVIVYRNLVGDSHTYYHESPRSPRGGLVLASNLADLLSLDRTSLRPCEEELPSYFLNRGVPGRNTLFAGYHRLLPGEELDHEGGCLRRRQRQTIGDLIEGRPIGAEAAERLDETIGQVLADYQAEGTATANLLSGGVDSSFLQAHWNRLLPPGSPRPRSYCVAVDHPRTRGDREYAESAAKVLGTRHCVVPADGPYLEYLVETMIQTGEMPGHVQLAYYLDLGRAMAERGETAAVLGEGADSLFGLSVATALQNASLLRRLLPSALLRRGAAAVAARLRGERVRDYFRLADYLHDYERLEHPVNRVAVYADWPAVEQCFGREAVVEAAAKRRALVDQHHVPDTPLERVHYAGVLGSSVNISALVTTLFARCGVRVFSPFYDSRMVRLAVSLSPRQRFRFRKPKALLKESLARQGFAGLAWRSKKSFGQPIFEWLAPGGQLAPAIERIDRYPFVPPETLEATKERPTWFLYSLLCYDLWNKLFVKLPLTRPTSARSALTAVRA